MNDTSDVYLPVSIAWHFMSQTYRDALGVLAGLSRVESCDLAYGWAYIPIATQAKLLRIMAEVSQGARNENA